MSIKTLKASVWYGIKPMEFDRQTEHFLFNAYGRVRKVGKFESYFEPTAQGFEDAKAFLIAYHQAEHDRAVLNRSHADRMIAQNLKRMEEIAQCPPPNL
jgi:hypothetical protein